MTLSFCAVLLHMLACQSPPTALSSSCAILCFADTSGMDFRPPYDLDDPDDDLELDEDELDEISGLSASVNERYLLAIQDEEGYIYYLDREDGDIEQRLDFWKDGDYEGVESVGADIWIVKSSGTLYRVREAGSVNQQVDKFNTILTRDNDVEGLAYDASEDRLLLACKAKAGDGRQYYRTKAIYAFNLQDLHIDREPAYCLRLDDVNTYLDTDPKLEKLDKIVSFFVSDEASLRFSRSSLALHLISCNLYMTSSVGEMLMIVSPQGAILYIHKFDEDDHPQPEGLCFQADGTLYISNEGKGGDPVLYRFNYTP